MDRDFYPVKERLVKEMNASKDAVMLVDVGGGHGHDIEEFRYGRRNLITTCILTRHLG